MCNVAMNIKRFWGQTQRITYASRLLGGCQCASTMTNGSLHTSLKFHKDNLGSLGNFQQLPDEWQLSTRWPGRGNSDLDRTCPQSHRSTQLASCGVEVTKHGPLHPPAEWSAGWVATHNSGTAQ